jgi:cytoskeletal protein RodZ
MQELPDDQLDQLFRKSAEEFEPEFNPQAWASMRKKLDDEDGKVGGFTWRKAGAAILLLLTMGGIGYYLWTNQKLDSKEKTVITGNSSMDTNRKSSDELSVTDKSTTSLESQQKSGESAQPSETKEDLQTENTKTIAQNALPSTSKLTESLETETTKAGINKSKIDTEPTKVVTERTKDKTSLSRRAATKNTSASSSVTGDNTNEATSHFIAQKASQSQKLKSATSPDLTKTNPKNHLAFQPTNSENQNSTKEKPLKLNSVNAIESNSPEPLADANSNVSLAENSHSTFLNLSKLTGHGWQFLKLAWPAPAVAYTPPPSPLAIHKKADAPTFFRKGLSARVMAGPDLSFISKSEMMKNPSLLLSIMLEYRFSKRFSVQAGVAKSSKLYNATGAQYEWPDAWYSQKARPTEIDANCKVLDIPINLRFDISQRPQSRWFATSGISSYRMLNEKYNYTYPPQTWGIKWPSWEGSTGNYWFGVLNMSMGFERQIGRNLSIQAEPYLKLPLAGVGLGKIKLNTSGIFISARYRLGHF